MATSRTRAPQKPQPELGSSDWTTNPLKVGLILLAVTTGLGFVGWSWVRFDSRLSALEGKMNKVEQDLADGGGRVFASKLEKSTSPQQAAASMTLARAQVQLNVAKGQMSNPKFVNAIAPAIADTAKKFPDLPDTWQTVSTVATYRTASLSKEPTRLPDCDSQNAQLQLLYQADYTEFKLPGGAVDTLAYLFKNCALHLSRLPGHSMPVQIQAPKGPIPAHIGSPAYAENCVIVLDDEGISDTDILWLEAHNCRFEFDVNRVPPRREQQLLLAALQGDRPDNERLPVNGKEG